MANINGIMKLRWYNPVWVMGFLWHIINNFWDNGRVAAGYMKKVEVKGLVLNGNPQVVEAPRKDTINVNILNNARR